MKQAHSDINTQIRSHYDDQPTAFAQFLVGLVVLWAIVIVAYIRLFVDCEIKK